MEQFVDSLNLPKTEHVSLVILNLHKRNDDAPYGYFIDDNSLPSTTVTATNSWSSANFDRVIIDLAAAHAGDSLDDVFHESDGENVVISKIVKLIFEAVESRIVPDVSDVELN